MLIFEKKKTVQKLFSEYSAKTNDFAKKTALNEKVLEVSTKAYWTSSSLIVQT